MRKYFLCSLSDTNWWAPHSPQVQVLLVQLFTSTEIGYTKLPVKIISLAQLGLVLIHWLTMAWDRAVKFKYDSRGIFLWICVWFCPWKDGVHEPVIGTILLRKWCPEWLCRLNITSIIEAAAIVSITIWARKICLVLCKISHWVLNSYLRNALVKSLP